MAKGKLKAENRQPTFSELRQMFLLEGKDGLPSFLPPDASPDDPRFPDYERWAAIRRKAFEATRDILCVSGTGRRYADLERSAKKILQPKPDIIRGEFSRNLKAFLALVSIHTLATGGPDSWIEKNRPGLSLTGEFWSKEWVPKVIAKLRERDVARPNENCIGKVFEAMAKGASGTFISKKTAGNALIAYIGMNAVRWKDEGKTLYEIHAELKAKGFKRWTKDRRDTHSGAEKQDAEENVRKALARFAQYAIGFDVIPFPPETKT